MEEKEDNQIISITEHLSRQKVSRIDFEILVNFYEICKKKKISEREVSFLMGKVNKYFSEILNPFFKEHIKTEYLDILPAIASTGIRKIIPNDISPKETIDIRGTHTRETDKYSEVDYYKFTVTYKDGTTRNYRWKIEVTKGSRSKVNPELLDILKKLISRHYFHKPKFALNIYIILKSRFKNAFSPLELQIALSKLTNKSVDPEFALQEGVDNMRITYSKILNETEKSLEHCQDHRIWISRYIPINTYEGQFFIWYEDSDENDKLLTSIDGNVLLSSSIEELLTLLKSNNDIFKAPVNLEAWLSGMEALPPTISVTYSPKEIIDGFEVDSVSVNTLADFVNFYNLVGDLGCQDERFEALLEFREVGELTKVWDYFCNNHLFKAKKHKGLSFDKSKFVADFRELVVRFESNIFS
ncbi:MAG: hypothetical protein LBV59_09825 [Sphingobacterium sp.]|jgi:hypothetical protein|uniref:hypothetical protein n=1 Tax=Sphingobacterium sp. TaxID=341027 RepID=UPI0028503A9F|nr:hypothetical protein [Sphingobacterium sp.]MDR3008220.1 hypothetical protein [Sphingobacterium sp.]